MRFDPFEVSTPHIVYAALGGFVVLFGMFSLFIREKLYIGEAIWAFLFGVVIGPYGANIFDPRGWGGGNIEVTNTITLEVTRVVLAIGVFAIGVELPKAYMQRHWKSLLFLLGPVMTWGWFVSGALIYALIPGLNFLSSLVVAACLTPTDPILAAAVVGGKYADKHVPAHLRHLLAAESGCNDGAAFPFLFIALYLTIDSSTGKAISDWFLLLWLYQVVMGCTFGGLLGFGFRHLMKFCESRDLIDRQSYVAQYVSLAMLTIGATTLLGSDDLLAAFCCGTAFAWDGFFNKQTEESVFSSVIDLLFNVAAFVFVGAWMPFNDFSNAELTLSVWRLIVIGILVMVLRRLPVVIALYRWIPDIKTFREAVFSGHFGPMGIGAVFISTLAAEQLPEAHSPPEGQQQFLAATIQPIVAFMVLCSIAVHGLSIPFFTFGRRVHSVSRTWSRHDTAGTFGSRRRSLHQTLPEWTTQTTLVRPGEAIVINRDGARGDAESTTPVSASTSQDEKHADDHDAAERGERGAGNPPDGTETVAEWKEGPHRVIERRQGPGTEVEVEVQRNAYGPSETRTETTRVAEDAAQRLVHDTLHRLRHAPEELEHVFGHAEQGIRQEARHVEERTKEAGQAALRTISPTSPSTKHGNGNGNSHEDDLDDEGWMSDQSAGGPPSPPRDASQSKRSKSPKIKIPKPKIVVGSGSRKRAARRSATAAQRPTVHRPQSQSGAFAVSARDYALDDTTSSSPEQGPSGVQTPVGGNGTGNESGGEQRGRSAALPSHRHPHLKLAHRRIDSIRSTAPSREMSPARSVRFADDGAGPGTVPGTPGSPTGASTPRLVSSMAHAEGGEGVHGHGHDDDSPRGGQAVRFSLPTVPPA